MIIQYQLDYPESHYHIFWQGALVFLANIVLSDKNDTEWYFFFVLCLRGYSGLSKAYPFARLCFKGLLSMAIAEGRLTIRQTRAFMKQLSTEMQSHVVRTGAMRLDLNTVTADENAVSAEALAGAFESVVCDDEEDDAVDS